MGLYSRTLDVKSGVTWMLWLDLRAPAPAVSHHRAFGGGEVDGVDARGQSLLQVKKDVGADAGAGNGALCRRRFVQKLLEAVEFNQQHHVLQEIALDKSRKLRGTKELHRTKMMHTREKSF